MCMVMNHPSGKMCLNNRLNTWLLLHYLLLFDLEFVTFTLLVYELPDSPKARQLAFPLQRRRPVVLSDPVHLLIYSFFKNLLEIPVDPRLWRENKKLDQVKEEPVCFIIIHLVIKLLFGMISRSLWFRVSYLISIALECWQKPYSSIRIHPRFEG